MVERQNRKHQFNKKLDKVYSNATIFKVAKKEDGRSKAQSMSSNDGKLQQLMDPHNTLPAPG